MLCPASTAGSLMHSRSSAARHTIRPLDRRPDRVERIGAEGADQLLDRADLLQIAVGQDRLRDFQPVMRAGLVPEQVRPRPDDGDQRHDEFFADRVDRRVGDLREELLEVVVEDLRPVRQRGIGVGAHRADWIVAVARHRLEDELDVFLGVAERLLPVRSGDGRLGRVGAAARANAPRAPPPGRASPMNRTGASSHAA